MRAKELEAFSSCPFPDDPMPVIEDTKSDCEQLRDAAWNALGNIRHTQVRQFALDKLQSDIENAWAAFIINYQEQDEHILIERAKSVEVDFECKTSWHRMQIDILNMVDNGLKAPAVLLFHIYNSTYCSCCRELALRQMGKRRLLTNEILEECLYDSNSDIRFYAKQYLNRRKTVLNI